MGKGLGQATHPLQKFVVGPAVGDARADAQEFIASQSGLGSLGRRCTVGPEHAGHCAALCAVFW